jgi:hypothetical protein
MLHRDAGMRIAFNAKPSQKCQALRWLLAEAMCAIAGKSLDIRRGHA